EGRRGEEEDLETEARVDASLAATVAGSFALIVLAEWGDLTQLATASLATTSASPVGTGIGSALALFTVAAIAVTVGRSLVERVPLHRINFVGAAVVAALAVWSGLEAIL